MNDMPVVTLEQAVVEFFGANADGPVVHAFRSAWDRKRSGASDDDMRGFLFAKCVLIQAVEESYYPMGEDARRLFNNLKHF